MRPPVAQGPSLERRAGLGLKPKHFQHILAARPEVGWFEFHPENYMGAGGPMHHYLERIRACYPLSMHGVGLSLGSDDGLDTDHLKALKLLNDRYQPVLVSEHLSWSRWQDVVLNDLLPLPYTRQALAVVCANIDQTQEALQRSILIENPASYLQAASGDFDEAEFLVEAAGRCGAGILLDVNNVYVSACNHGFDARSYIDQIPAELVGEIHLAGHKVERVDGGELRIDDHGSPVCAEVWELYRFTLRRLGPVPTLVEWDTDVPEWAVLHAEGERAHDLLRQCSTVAA